MRTVKGIMIAAGIAVAALTAFLGYIGYFSASPFTAVAATAAPAASQRGVTAVLLSGDMGFNIGMGPKIAKRLAARGIPVIGVNSLSYFRTRRTAKEAGALIARAMERALMLPGAKRVLLIGQSFGADMLQVGLPVLPEALRRKVVLVALVVPGDTIDFQASPSELFNLVPPDAQALPTARKLDWVPLLCVSGALETDSLCPLLAMPNIEHVVLPGGHPLQGDADRLHAVLAASLARALAR